MRLLLVDAGNTAVKWAISDHAQRRWICRGVHDHGASDDLDARLAAAWTSLTPTAAYGISVAEPSVMHAIERAARAAGGLAVTWLGAQSAFEGCGPRRAGALRSGYRDPTQLGADRWHGMIAACARFPGESLVVVSAGTATTVDCVQAGPGAALFVGGAIAPGFDLMRVSLARGTARLPLVEACAAVAAPLAYPTSTEEAIATGVFRAQLGLVENTARAFAADLSRARRQPPRLLLTGGRGQALLEPLKRSLLGAGVVGALVPQAGLALRGVALRAHAEQADTPPAAAAAAVLR